MPWKLPKVEKKNINAPLEDFETQLTERKNKWLELQEEYPDKSKTELRKIAPDVYVFLYRNDRDWLNEFSPTKKRIQTPNQRVNWKKRDTELLNRVQKVVRNWDKDADKPIKITVTSIGRKINELSLLQKKQIKYPKLWNISVKYQRIQCPSKRRVEFTIEKLKQEGEAILEWQIYRKAGLRPTVSDEVKRLISLRLTEYETVTK